MTIEFAVTEGQRLRRVDSKKVAASTTDLYAAFSLTQDFSGVVSAYWRKDAGDTVYTTILDDAGTCLVPWEVLLPASAYRSEAHKVCVSIADADRTTSSECKFEVLPSVYVGDAGMGGRPPTDAYQQVLELLNNGSFATDIPAATAQRLGLVRSSDVRNGISVHPDGSMEVNSLDVSRLVQTESDTLILNGGNAKLK